MSGEPDPEPSPEGLARQKPVGVRDQVCPEVGPGKDVRAEREPETHEKRERPESRCADAYTLGEEGPDPPVPGPVEIRGPVEEHHPPEDGLRASMFGHGPHGTGPLRPEERVAQGPGPVVENEIPPPVPRPSALGEGVGRVEDHVRLPPHRPEEGRRVETEDDAVQVAEVVGLGREPVHAPAETEAVRRVVTPVVTPVVWIGHEPPVRVVLYGLKVFVRGPVTDTGTEPLPP